MRLIHTLTYLIIYVYCLAWYLYLRLYICHVLVTSLPVGVDHRYILVYDICGVDDVLSGERENFDVDLLVVVVVVEVVVVSGPTVQII